MLISSTESKGLQLYNDPVSFEHMGWWADKPEMHGVDMGAHVWAPVRYRRNGRDSRKSLRPKSRALQQCQTRKVPCHLRTVTLSNMIENVVPEGR